MVSSALSRWPQTLVLKAKTVSCRRVSARSSLSGCPCWSVCSACSTSVRNACRFSPLFLTLRPDRLQRRAQVVNDVVPVFQPNGDADPAGIDAAGLLLFWRQVEVGHGVGILDQRLHLAQADGQGHGVGVL